jgi:hypothetical protein
MYSHLKESICGNNILKSKIQHIRQEGFEPIVEKVHDNISNNVAITLEKELIAKYGRITNNTGTLCNFTDGGEGTDGYKHRPETKQLFSNMRRGRKQTVAQYQANCNRIISDTTKKKISESQIGVDRLSPEIREKIRLSNIGQKRSEETKKLLSAQRKGKKQTLAQYQANCNRIRKHKQILCLTNNTIYNSATHASEVLNLKKSSITSVANNNKPSIKGYKFIYTGVIIKSDIHPSSCSNPNYVQ